MQRLGFLDAARALGAFMVFLYHFCSEYPNGIPILPAMAYIHLGEAGICLFFLISGFVIPISLERHSNLAAFAIARFCRLYIPYCFVLILVQCLCYLGLSNYLAKTQTIPSWKELLVNLTMFHQMVGVKALMMVAWMLSIEVMFYILSAFIYWIKPRSHAHVLLSACGVLLTASIAGWILHIRIPVFPMGFILTALAGQAIYYAWDGRISRMHAFGLVVAAWTTCMVALALRGQLYSLSGISTPVILTSWTVGYLLFGLFLLLRKMSFGPLLFLGKISYSFFLVHCYVIFLSIQFFPFSLGAFFFCLILSLLLAILFYNLIEIPGIKLGQWLINTNDLSRNGHGATKVHVPNGSATEEQRHPHGK